MRYVVFLLATACGGAPFTALEERPANDGGALFDAGMIPLSPDAAPDVVSIAEDAGIADSAPDSAPACASRPTVAKVCGSTGMTFDYPTSICVEVCDHVGCTYDIQKTPVQCASWCTFTCTCLQADAGVCPGSESCVQSSSDGTAFISCP